MERWILLLLLLGWAVQPGAAQRHASPSQSAEPLEWSSAWEASPASETTGSDSSRYRYIESFGGGLLGAAIGGGLGALAGFGSVLGFFIGFGAFAVASDGHGGWTTLGLGVGAAAGAAFGAVVWAPEYRGFIRHDDEQWTVGMPDMQWQSALREAEPSRIRVVLLSARF